MNPDRCSGRASRRPGSRRPPAADAEIYRSSAGFHVSLDASGLAKLPDGEYYQAWLKNAHDVLVPIGSFSSSDGNVTLWSGVSPREFNTLSVTIEKTDGDPGFFRAGSAARNRRAELARRARHRAREPIARRTA